MNDYIDNEKLISLVEARPPLWDKTLEIFKDRNATRNAWHEVFLSLRSDFDELKEKEKNDYGKEVMKRWKHLRDAFAKYEKTAKENRTTASHPTKKRKYIFNDELQFLKKIYDKTETTDSFIIEEKSMSKEETESISQAPENTIHEVVQTTATNEKALPSQTRKKHKKMDDVNLKILKDKTEFEVPSPQMSFYHSLLPHTKDFSSNDWLQFQMEVLRVISNIKNQKYAAAPYQGYNTQSYMQLQHSTPYHPQTQTYSQPLHHPFPMVPHYPLSHHPPFDLPSAAPVLQNVLPTPPSQPCHNSSAFTTLASCSSQPSLLPHHDSSMSLLIKEKVKKPAEKEHFGEDDRESSSVSSLNSSST
ncbi:uncharacterized protein TNCT_232991 [Trichonephila clavata]|uniref:MADF domain-containing protein n=1 Tax=Trichonephila clavata TaxID=2740835 RepID=A0A8X6JML1_TRICU|nr:uncharacterized protein TNCT_232991 [Trichonephila clavata]